MSKKAYIFALFSLVLLLLMLYMDLTTGQVIHLVRVNKYNDFSVGKNIYNGLGGIDSSLEKFEPPDGSSYFGFTLKAWDNSVVLDNQYAAYGDLRDFSIRMQDSIDNELGGKYPSIMKFPVVWEDSSGNPINFGKALQDINLLEEKAGFKITPIINWQAATGWDFQASSYYNTNGGNVITTKKIADGLYDNYIRQYARDVKAWGRPLFIVPISGEFNGPWAAPCSPNVNPNPQGITIEHFINSWKRVVDIFNEEGVTNVAWLWIPNTFPPSEPRWGIDPDIRAYYPGDEYVDWMGADHYDFDLLNVRGFMDPVYEFSVEREKPFFLAEWGVRHSGSQLTPQKQEQWLNSMFDYFETHPNIKAINYFNYNMNNPSSECNPGEVCTSQQNCNCSGMIGQNAHTWIYDGQVNYQPNANDNDHRLISESGAKFRSTFKDRISDSRYIASFYGITIGNVYPSSFNWSTPGTIFAFFGGTYDENTELYVNGVLFDKDRLVIVNPYVMGFIYLGEEKSFIVGDNKFVVKNSLLNVESEPYSLHAHSYPIIALLSPSVLSSSEEDMINISGSYFDPHSNVFVDDTILPSEAVIYVNSSFIQLNFSLSLLRQFVGDNLLFVKSGDGLIESNRVEFKVNSVSSCGDGVCSSLESCSSCESDCGKCSGGGGGGGNKGGGGSGSTVVNATKSSSLKNESQASSGSNVGGSGVSAATKVGLSEKQAWIILAILCSVAVLVISYILFRRHSQNLKLKGLWELEEKMMEQTKLS